MDKYPHAREIIRAVLDDHIECVRNHIEHIKYERTQNLKEANDYWRDTLLRRTWNDYRLARRAWLELRT